MSKTLTVRQEQILDYIKDVITQKHRPPSFREISTEFGYKSINAVTEHLNALERKGFLKKHSYLARSIELLEQPASHEIPLVGTIAAGQPVLSSENIEGTISFNSLLDADFALKVHGESMINAGIMDGDIILVKMQPAAEHRDIVVAMLDDGETTVKRLIKSSDIILRPENDSMKDIIVEGDIRIIGKVTGLLRKYD